MTSLVLAKEKAGIQGLTWEQSGVMQYPHTVSKFALNVKLPTGLDTACGAHIHFEP
jgi:hypothetical protein